jgi:hypothetical protein
MRGPEALQCDQPILTRHGEIQENDIRLVPRCHLQNFIAMACFSNDVEVRHRRKQLPHAIPEEQVVVRDENANSVIWIRDG